MTAERARLEEFRAHLMPTDCDVCVTHLDALDAALTLADALAAAVRERGLVTCQQCGKKWEANFCCSLTCYDAYRAARPA